MLSATTGRTSPVDRFFEFSLLGLLTSGYLAVVGSGYLDAPTVVLAALALVLRGLLVAGVLRLRIPAALVAAATLGYMGFYFIDYAFVSRSFLPATVHLVFFIASVKILTATTNRDYFFVKVVAFLELLAACVLSSSANFFVFLALFLLLGVATFASSEIRRSAQQNLSARTSMRTLSPRLAGVTVFVSCGILVLTAFLFFLLPRTARAAFRHLLPQRYHIAGFSNQVSLAETGEIRKSDTPVMHVKMDQIRERPLALKWRGAALAQFDGLHWFNMPAGGEVLRADSAGEVRLSDWRRNRGVISYAVHVNELDPDGTLFFAGTPQFLRIDAPMIWHTASDSYRLMAPGRSAATYQVYSYLDLAITEAEANPPDPIPMRLKPELRDLYLRLPPLDPRIPALAETITASHGTPAGRSRAIENYLRTHYGYTLELPQVSAAEPLADFLFHRKKGHCEYFASAMAVMLRTVGIPSRVVTGFQSGVYNPISGWQLIRASDAHSWVEAYLPRLGWTTFDPTPPDPNPPRLTLFSRLGFYVDAAEVFWQDWVLNYNLDRQLQLATRMEESSRNVRLNWFDDIGGTFTRWKTQGALTAMAWGAGIFGCAVLGLIFRTQVLELWRWWRTRLRVRKVQRGEAHRTDATLLYERMLQLLKRRGIEKPIWLTPNEFVRVLPERELAILVEDLTLAYNDLRFGGKPEAAGRMVSLLTQLESPIRPVST